MNQLERLRFLVTLGVLALAALTAGCAPRLSSTPAPVVYSPPSGEQYAPPVVQSVPMAPPGAAASPPLPREVVVLKGETLYSLSRRHGVTLRDLIAVNRLKAPYLIAPGQNLVLPRPTFHVVGEGDTIFGIAERYGIDAMKLVQINQIRPPYGVAVGQWLKLPRLPDRRVAARGSGAPVPAARPTVKPGAAPGYASRPARGPATSRPPVKTSRLAQSRQALRPPKRSGRGFLWPVRGRIITRFGSNGKGRHNDGINIAAHRGAAVRAIDNGVVAYTGNELRGFGKLLLIKHDGGWMSAYAHNDKLLVKVGERVWRGQTISRVGSTGSVKRPQLHFELRRGSRAVDPTRYLTSRAASSRGVSPAAGRGGRRGPG